MANRNVEEHDEEKRALSDWWEHDLLDKISMQIFANKINNTSG